MADKNDSGDKTEKPTPKKLEDARKKGDVPKSTEITNTAELILWLVLFGFGLSLAGDRIVVLMNTTFAGISGNFASAAPTLAWMALETTLIITAMFLLPIAAFGLLVEFLQTGPVLSLEKIKPTLVHLNPAEGIKRIFSLDSLVEGIKALVKTMLLLLIGWWVLKALLPELALLPHANIDDIGAAMWETMLKLLGWTLAIFAFVSILDAAYQRHSFLKKMRMSQRDIQQEVKDNEGDPYIKSQRRQAHQEWSQHSAAQVARDATALIVNPTHVAIALDYDRDTCPVPTIAAKGEDHVARAMRAACEDAGVPIIRNVELARDLLARAETGDIIPRDLFDIIAEVVLWAREVREEIDSGLQNPLSGDTATAYRRAPPGENLTRYPDHCN